MKAEVLILISAALIFTSFSSAQLDFKTENPINFYSSQDLNGNDVYNLSEIITDGTTNLQFNQNGDVVVPQGSVDIESGQLNLFNGLRINESGVIRSQRSDGDIKLELGSSGTGELNIENSADERVLRALEEGKIIVSKGNLDLRNNKLRNLSAPVTGTDAANYAWVDTNFINRSGDTLNGSLNYNGYDILNFGNSTIGVSSPKDRIILKNTYADTTNADSPKLSFFGDIESGVAGPSIQKINTGTYGRGDLVFYQYGATDYSTEFEAMRIGYNGNVKVPNGNLGVGTSSPSGNLVVSDGSSSGTSIEVENSGSGASSLCLDANGGQCTGTDYLILRQTDNGDSVLGNWNSGSLGIRTDNTDGIRIDTSQNIQTPNGNIDTVGNNITSSNGEICAGDLC